ncbi:MAG TPA: tetratricopeptide repeat protein [Ktedonobacteraceae bacterium]|nr:tetratricopeptide repeat protein [Ktedonobacteraceae bacterium]
MPFIEQAFRPQIETGSSMIGRTNEQYFFIEHVLRQVKPAYSLISVWGEAGVGKSTLLTRFRDTARSTEFKDVCLTALVDEWPVTPAHLMERVSMQLRSAGAPLVAFEQALARYRHGASRRQPEQAFAQAALLREGAALAGAKVMDEPVLGGLYAAVARESSAAFWNQLRASRSTRTKVSLADALDELTRAFVEDLNWLTSTQVVYPSYRSRRGLRVFLFFDGIETSAVETVDWLRNHLLAASMNQNVVLVFAGRDSIAPVFPHEQPVYSMPLARFTEDETRLYLAARGVIAASRCDTIWQVSRGLPLALSLLTLDHEAVIDPQEDTSANVLHWLSRQEQSKQQLVLHSALFSGPFHQDDITAFRFLPESEHERVRLYRWLIALPFVQHRVLDGRHHYHRLAREWFSQALLQRSAQDYQVGRRALANYYGRQLARLQGDGGQQLSTSTDWLEPAQALVYQFLCLPDDASHMSAIEQGLAVAHTAKHAEAIILLLRECLQESPQSLIDVGARTLAGELLRALEADRASQEFLAAASVLIERVSRVQTFPAPLLARIYGKRGIAYCSHSEYRRAISDFDQALSLDPTYAWAYVLRGMAFSAGEEYQRAIADFDQALALDARAALAYAHRGIACTERGEYQRAIVDFDLALVLDPEIEGISLLRNQAYWKLHAPGQGKEEFEYSLELDPSDSQALVQRGMAYCYLDEERLAIADFNRALELDPGNAQAYAGRGHVYLEMGEIERARVDLLRSQERAPHDVYVGLLLEWLDLCQEEVFPEGPDFPERMEALAVIDRQQPAAFVCQGVALLLRRRFEEALVVLDQVLLMNPQMREASFWKSMVSALLGRDEEARAALERVKVAELPLPEALFAPLRWLKQKRPEFYRAYAAPLVAHP